jgi:ribosome-binding protein aMBF1 (putative translation factor)
VLIERRALACSFILRNRDREARSITYGLSGLYYKRGRSARWPCVDFSKLLKAVGANVRKARWLRGLTQEELASKGLSYRYLAEIERGERNVTLRTLADLAKILGVTVGDLVEIPGVRRRAVPLHRAKASAPPRGRKAR